MPQTIAVVAAVASVAGTVHQVAQAQDAKKEAKKQANIQAAQRRLQIQREKAILARDTRIKRAAIVNNSGLVGLQNSSISSQALQGMLSKEGGQRDYLAQGLDLALQGDEITKNQIERDASAAQMGAISSGIGALASNKEGVTVLTDLFSSEN